MHTHAQMIVVETQFHAMLNNVRLVVVVEGSLVALSISMGSAAT